MTFLFLANSAIVLLSLSLSLSDPTAEPTPKPSRKPTKKPSPEPTGGTSTCLGLHVMAPCEDTRWNSIYIYLNLLVSLSLSFPRNRRSNRVQHQAESPQRSRANLRRQLQLMVSQRSSLLISVSLVFLQSDIVKICELIDHLFTFFHFP